MFGENETDSETFGRWQVQIKPTWQLTLGDGRTLTIFNNSKGVGELGSRVWDGSLVLARYLEKNPGVVRARRCIELGSGAGLGGVAAAMCGADVILTDKQARRRTFGFSYS